jgi:hypothetical protein
MKQQWVGRTNEFVLVFYSWLNHHQGAYRTRGELGMGRALLGLLPNRWSRLIDSENERYEIS